MEKDCEQFKKRVLCRINRVYVWRTYTRPVVIESFILMILVGSAFCMASAHHIVANAYSSKMAGSLTKFIIDMFGKTEFSMKVLSLAVGVLTILIARDMFGGLGIVTRKIRSSFS